MLNFKFNIHWTQRTDHIYNLRPQWKTQIIISSSCMNFKCTERQISRHHIFKHVCVKGNTINKTNGTGGSDDLNSEEQRPVVKYSQETEASARKTLESSSCGKKTPTHRNALYREEGETFRIQYSICIYKHLYNWAHSTGVSFSSLLLYNEDNQIKQCTNIQTL